MPSTQHAYDHVAGIYLPIAIGVFVLVAVLLAALLLLGARRRVAGTGSEAPRVEGLYALTLACVAGALVWVTFAAEAPIDRLVARPGLRVEVTAAQWSWTFRYGNGTTVVAVSTWSPPVAVVPIGVEVEFDGTSRDVIHGFWVPDLHFQRQLVPGFTTKFDLIFAKAGLYSGECSVFCGENHPEMHFAIEAVSGRRFRTWLASHGRTL